MRRKCRNAITRPTWVAQFLQSSLFPNCHNVLEKRLTFVELSESSQFFLWLSCFRNPHNLLKKSNQIMQESISIYVKYYVPGKRCPVQSYSNKASAVRVKAILLFI